jgi:hypothetical protein
VENQNENKNVVLSPEVIRRAAAYGADLLNTKGAVKIDAASALTGDLQVLHIILQNIGSGEVILARPENPPPQDDIVVESGAEENGTDQE